MKYKNIDYKIVVGKQVRRLRLKAGMTQDILSERCGIYRTYLSRIEAGSANPTLLILIALSASLDVPIGDLFEPIDETAEHSTGNVPMRARRARE
jgi:transcriptional regulator with XRE-family HTH domain